MSTLLGLLVRFTDGYADPDVNGRVVAVARSKTDGFVLLILRDGKLHEKLATEVTVLGEPVPEMPAPP